MRKSATLKNGKTLLVRNVHPEDAAAMLEYLKRVGGETDNLTFGPEGVGYSLEEEQDFIRSKAKDDNQLFIVGIVEGEIVASLGLLVPSRERVSHCGEFGMSVRKDCWNIGVGGVLMDHMIEWAKKQPGLRKINLSVRADNRRAINLYLKKGFAIEGCNRGAIRIDATLFDVYIMGLFL